MAKTKVYGVMGLIEWKPVIHVGQATFSPLFTGGSVSGFGVTPAIYKTASVAEQHIIEHSPQFRSGRITLRYTLDTGDAAPAVTKTSNTKTEAVKESVQLPPHKSTATAPVNVTERKEFTSLNDARTWMCETYGVDRASVLTRAAVVKAARAKGVEITFKD